MFVVRSSLTCEGARPGRAEAPPPTRMESPCSGPIRVMPIDREAAGPGLAELAERLSRAIADGVDVILDLAEVDRLESSLLATIIAADKTARARGRPGLPRGGWGDRA